MKFTMSEQKPLLKCRTMGEQVTVLFTSMGARGLGKAIKAFEGEIMQTHHHVQISGAGKYVH